MLFHSLQRTLILILTSLIVLVISIATLQAYQITFNERQQVHDLELYNLATLMLQTEPKQSILDTQSSLFVRHKINQVWVDSSNAPEIVPTQMGYHEHVVDGTLWRVFAMQKDGAQVVVGFPKTLVFNEIEAFILPTITPFLISLPILALVIFVVVKLQLRPLAELDSLLTQQNDFQFEPLQMKRSFQELMPVVDTINALLTRLKASYEREQSFSANVAHELKTPLTTLSLTIDNLLSEHALEEEATEHLNAMRQQLKRVNSVVDSLLLLAKTHPHFYQAQHTSTDIYPLIQDKLSDLYPTLSLKNQHISFDCEPGDYRLYTTPVLIGIVLENTVLNAHKYCPDHAQINVKLSRDNTHLAIEIKDDGKTLNQDTIQGLASRFTRGTHREISGSGLGLSIVQQIMDIHHGTMTLSIDPQWQGLNVCCRFPIEPNVCED